MMRPAAIRVRFAHFAALAVAVCLLIVVGPLSAQERLIDQEPFDEITLDEENGNAVLRTRPLELKNRMVPEKPDPLSRLQLRLADRPKRLYECEWQHIVKVRLFEQMVLEEAERLTAVGDFAEAFANYDYLLANFPKTRGLQTSIDGFLYQHAVAEAKAKQYERAFELLIELAGREPDRKNLDRAIDSVAKRVIIERVRQERFVAARGTIDLVRRLLPQTPLPEVLKLRDQLIGEATRLRDKAQADLAAGQLRSAQLASRRAVAVWPDVEGVRELAREIDEKYPIVMVGTMRSAASTTGDELDDWPSRRIARLLARQPVELIGFSAEGGIYRSPLGSLARDESGIRWTIQLRPGMLDAAGNAVTGYEIARMLLRNTADGSSSSPYDPWADALKAVSVKQVYGVQMLLARPLVRPERLLQTSELVPIPWPGHKQSTSTPEFLRPYELGDVGSESRFYANRKYFGFAASQPQELIEQHHAEPEDALQALRRGEIDVLDRVCPWDVTSLSNSETIVTGRYLLPTVHALLPNPKRPLPANRTFRRAVLYGINREVILNRVLLAGRSEEGSQVVSGPFAASAAIDDAAGYGSDNQIKPAPYEPRLSIALQVIAEKELHPDTKPDKLAEKESPSLVIAHVADPVHKLACAAIAEQLKRIGFVVTLAAYDPAKTGPPEDFDFRYAELAAWEPVVDARRLLGEQGLTGNCNAYMSLALAKLDRADTWKEIRARLKEIHRIAADELVVLPLYQTVNHYAYRRGAVELGKSVVSLYENVEGWKQNARQQAAR